MITVYGSMFGSEITCNDKKIYRLAVSSAIQRPIIGWFQIEEVNGKWLLNRFLEESRVDVYPGWNSDLS